MPRNAEARPGPETLDRRRTLQLLGTGLSLPVLASRPALASGRSASFEQRSGRSLSAEQSRTVERLCDLILPATDTPGAADAGVHHFVDLLLAEWFPKAGRRHYLKGLRRLDRSSRERFGDRFADCAREQQVALLEELEEEAERERNGEPWSVGDGSGLADAHFFDVSKWMTLVGYYTSEVGMREELDFRLIAGRYEPCLELGKS